MENKNYVSVEDFQKYTEYVSGVLSNVKESTNSNNDEVMEKLIKYTAHIAEKVNQVTDYAEYLSENLDKNISYSDYLAENVNSIKDYATYLAEELDGSIQYAEHVAEMADKGIQYSNYVAENVEKSIDYSEYVAEKVDQNIAYSEYLGENVDKSIKYSEYIAENINTPNANSINEGTVNEYGKMEGATPTMEEVSKCMDEGMTYEQVCEKYPDADKGKLKEMCESCGKTHETVDYKNSIEEKLEKLIAAAEVKNVSEMHFMNFLGESKKNEFNSLSTEKQAMIVESMNAKPIMSTIQAENIWESNFIEKKRELDVVSDMPEKFQEKWNNLSENRKNQIISESRFHPVNNQYGINNFWSTRDLRDTQIVTESINESKTAAESAATKEPLINESFRSDLVEKMKFRLGR